MGIYTIYRLHTYNNINIIIVIWWKKTKMLKM